MHALLKYRSCSGPDTHAISPEIRHATMNTSAKPRTSSTYARNASQNSAQHDRRASRPDSARRSSRPHLGRFSPKLGRRLFTLHFGNVCEREGEYSGVRRATGFEEAVEVETEEEEAFVSPLTGTTEVLRFMTASW